MGTGTATTKVVKAEKVMPNITLKPRTTRREIAATTNTWAIETNISKDIELDIKAAMMTPIIIVREGSLRSMAVKTLAKEGPHALDDFRAVVELNLIASFDFLRLCAERMARNAPNADGERGVVISTASIAAFEGQIGQVAYAAAKSGIVGMTFVAARDLGSVGVRAMTIAPSLFQTGLTQGIPDAMAAGLTKDAAFPKRMGRPIEYARMALAIIENPMLNGSTIRLDGGQRFAPK